MIVVDASVLVTALADDNDDGRLARSRLRHEKMLAPQVVDLEVLSVLRRLARTGLVEQHRVESAIVDLIDLPLQRADHTSLLHRCWQLRENVTIYDAAYVALAEALNLTLLTADVRLAQAPGIHCPIEVLATPLP